MSYNEDNIFIISDFDDSMERDIILPLTLEIQKQSALKNGRIDLYVNSFGGYRHLAFHLVELIELAKRDGVIVRTVVTDVAYSCGSIIAIAGTPGERYISKNGEHLLHYGSTGSFESTPEQVTRNAKQKKLGFKKVLAHYRKHTKISNKELDVLMNDDSGFLSASKCIKLGFADKYMKNFDIGEARGRKA